jgi:hypothetical protein
MRQQPLGLVSIVTKVVANSLTEALKWPPRIPLWFIARGTKRFVEMFSMGLVDLARVFHVLLVFSLADIVVGAFRCVS